MATNESLKSLLQNLINAPEPEIKSVMTSLIKTLRDACGLYRMSGSADYCETARKIQKILDDILADSGDSAVPQDFTEDEWEEEEFVESDTYAEEKAETFTSTQPRLTAAADASDRQGEKLARQIAKWNNSAKGWLQLPTASAEKEESVITLIFALAAQRSNIVSNQFEGQEDILRKFDENWREIASILQESGFLIKPDTLTPTDVSHLSGKVIYACRPRSTGEEIELVAPGISFNRQVLKHPVWVVALPMDAEFPKDHTSAGLPSHWRGVFGEIDLLLEYFDMQPNAFCAVEGINKNRVDPLDEYRSAIIAETKRRAEVLNATIQKENESSYRLATDYWRIEECFWSIFHDDERPAGCSCFDRLRTRLQSWRTTLRRILKFNIRDFACGNDSLASVNQYIGNIILQPIKNVSAGTVIRELRPAIVVKDQSTSRLLKGRVIAT